MLALCSIVNIIPAIYDSPRTSVLISASYAIGIAGIFIIFRQWKKQITVAIPDFVMIILSIVLILFPPLHTLLKIGYINLLLLYFIIRITTIRISYIKVYYIILSTLFLLSGIGYLQYFKVVPSNNPYFEITGSYHNPAVYANIMVLLLSIITSFSYLYYTNKRLKKLIHISIIVSIICLPALVLANSRSAWFALVIVFLYLFVMVNGDLKKKYNVLKIAGAIILITIPSLFLLYKLKPDSADGRLLIWKVSLNMVKDKPLRGHGTDGFTANYMHYQKRYLETEANDREKYLANNNYLSYNEPLEIVVEHGCIGLLVYIVLIYLLLFKIPNGKQNIVFKSFIVAYLVLSLFSYPNKIFPILMWFVVICSFLANSKRSGELEIRLNSKATLIMKLIMTLILVVLPVKLVQSHLGYNKIYKILTDGKQIPLREKIITLAELENPLSGDIGFMLIHAHLLSESRQDPLCLDKIDQLKNIYPTNNLYIFEGDCLKRLQRYKEAEQSYWYAHYMIPSRQKARGKLAFLYKKTGRYTQGKQIAEEILTEKVKIYGFQTYELHQKLRKAFLE